jgi:hypothetical protein
LPTRTGPRHRDGRRYALKSTVMVVMVVVMVMVMPMMRRVRQRDVCEKYQCDREAYNLTHDSIPNLCRRIVRRAPERRTPAHRIACDARHRAVICIGFVHGPHRNSAASFSQQRGH